MEWIATRSGDAVRRQWPAYVERDQIWENILDEHHRIAGYQVTTARRPLAYYLLIGDVSSNESSHFRARDDLFREASQGRVRVYGFNGRPAGVEIPAADFQRLGISLDPQADRDVLVWRSQDGDNLGVAYTEPVVASADVIRVWPPERQPHAFAINANAFIRAANNGDDILLAEAVGWIAELHGDGDSALEAAEQALFKRLFNARTDIARGVPWPLQHGQDRISEPISFGVFEYPNQPGGPQIHYVDEMLHTEAGGVVVTSARQWNGVKVPAKWMIAQWPPLDGAQPSVKQTRSGMPGRPTSAQFLLAEFHRRREAGQLLETCAAEARHLSEWLKAVHPLEAQARPRSIENTIRGAYQAAKPIKLPH
jgi:hypothetical protein